MGYIDDGTSTVDAKDVEALERMLADRFVALSALYADLKSKQLTLGIMLTCALVGVICACMGCICLWERQAATITETPFEERTRRFKAALGGDSGSQNPSRASSDNPFAERQRQLRRQVRRLPADNDDDGSGENKPQLGGQAGDATASGPNGTATSSLRRRQRVHGHSTVEQSLINKVPAADTAAQTMTTGGTDAAAKAMSNSVNLQPGGWLSWLPFRTAGAPRDELVRRQMKGQYAERQAHLRQQIRILPADDSDD